MDYLVVNGMGGVPQRPVRVTAPIQNRVVSARGPNYVPTPTLSGKINYTGLHRIVNRFGVTIPGDGGTGPTIPTFGQIYPSGR